MPEYFFILLLIFIISLSLHRLLHLRLFRSLRHMILFYGIVLSAGILWDQYAIARGHWSFGSEFLLGPRIGSMPVEEYGFGIVMPYFGLIIYRITEQRRKK